MGSGHLSPLPPAAFATGQNHNEEHLACHSRIPLVFASCPLPILVHSSSGSLFSRWYPNPAGSPRAKSRDALEGQQLPHCFSASWFETEANIKKWEKSPEDQSAFLFLLEKCQDRFLSLPSTRDCVCLSRLFFFRANPRCIAYDIES